MVCLGRLQLRLFSGTQPARSRILVRLRVFLRHESGARRRGPGSDGGGGCNQV
jgi:hypothetical protein